MASLLWLLSLLILIVIPILLYISLIIYKQCTIPDSYIVPISTKLLDPLIQTIFLLPWNIFRALEHNNALQAHREKIFQVQDVEIKREDGTNMKLRIYRPNDKSDLPVVVNYHGGGFAIGSVDSTDPSCRELCHRIECIIVSVEYRLSPEYPFPHGFNDSYYATKWVYQNARSIGGDPNRMAVMGDSAGGNFAAGICLHNSDREHEDFKLVYQVLIYPSADLRPTVNRPSKVIFHHGWFYSTRQSRKFREAYMTDYDKDSQDYRASPFVYAGKMDRVPDAFILIAKLDPLRDEGRDYAQKLTESGVDVKIQTYDATHGFFDMKIQEARRAHDDVVDALRNIFYGKTGEDAKVTIDIPFVPS